MVFAPNAVSPSFSGHFGGFNGIVLRGFGLRIPMSQLLDGKVPDQLFGNGGVQHDGPQACDAGLMICLIKCMHAHKSIYVLYTIIHIIFVERSGKR